MTGHWVMEKKPPFASAFGNPRIVIRFVFLLLVLLGLVTIAGNSRTAVAGAQESSVAPATSVEGEDEERREPALDSAEEIKALKMRLEARGETAAAMAGPVAPTAPPANDTCAGAEVIP